MKVLIEFRSRRQQLAELILVSMSPSGKFGFIARHLRQVA